jgi:hypothetical protein
MKSKLVEAYKEERKEIFNKRFGVIFNGEDNLKPLIVENLIDSSPTATQCAWIYESFLGGGGFEVDMSKFDVSGKFWETVNPNELLFEIAESASRQQGAFVHVGYNANFQKDSFQLIPYSLCRLGQKDSEGFSGKILMSPKGWGKALKKEDVEVFDTYNPNPDIIQAQVEAAGGWENYKGQIAFLRLSKKYTYPKSLIETAYTFADVENHLGLYYNSTVKRGFEDLTLIRHLKFPSQESEDQFFDNLKKVSGVENASSKLAIEDEWNDEATNPVGKFKFDTLKNEVKAEKYAHFETSAANYIRKSFKNIPPQLVDYVAGKLGNTSGEDLLKAQAIYHSLVGRDQEKIEQFFAELFWNYKEDINPTGNWKIKQYSLLDDGTAEEGSTGGAVGAPSGSQESDEDREARKEIRTAQATLRGSVGGVTSILDIQNSVSLGTTTYDSGVAMLENIFGYSTEVAKRILGQPAIDPNKDDTSNNQG